MAVEKVPWLAMDAPTQRAYAAAAFVLLQAFKLSDVLTATESSGDFWKWTLLDLVFVCAIKALRIPRLERLSFMPFVALSTLNLVLLGNFKFKDLLAFISPLLIATIRSYIPRTVVTTHEQSISQRQITGSDSTYLGRVHTIRTVPLATVSLDLAQCFCLPVGATQPILIPLKFNNTLPSTVTYSVTSFDSTSDSKLYTVNSAHLLAVKPKSHVHDETANLPRHTLPIIVHSTESTWLLPVLHVGQVRLVSAEGQGALPIRVRQRGKAVRGLSAPDADGVVIRQCPRVGFSTKAVIHACKSATERIPLVLAVDGFAPLSLQYRVHQGTTNSFETLDSIVKTGSTLEDLINVPLNVSAAREGSTILSVATVVDACGNKGTKTLPGTSRSVEVVVHVPPRVAFDRCPLSIIPGKATRMTLRIDGNYHRDSKFVAKVRFTPDATDVPSSIQDVIIVGKSGFFDAIEAGEYEVASISSDYCAGIVRSSEGTCRLVLRPLPSLATTFVPLLDSCASSTGVVLSLSLVGAPPFRISYDVVRNNKILRHAQVSTSHFRHELEVQFVEGPGDYELQLTNLSDRFHSQVPLSSPDSVVHQTVNRLSGAEWSQKTINVRGCDRGNTFETTVALKGGSPYTLSYVVAGERSQTVVLQESTSKVNITIPTTVTTHGGKFEVTLETIQDKSGCLRKLYAAPLLVEVDRTRISARFEGVSPEQRQSLFRDDSQALLPLRLSGIAPWTVRYQLPVQKGTETLEMEFRANSPRVDIVLKNPREGEYRLLGVHDRYCAGEVNGNITWTLGKIPRPVLLLADVTETSARSKNGTIARAAVCAGVVDSVQLVAQGTLPIQAKIMIASSNSQRIDRHTFSQTSPALVLDTKSPGIHRYQLESIGNALYPLESAKSTAQWELIQHVHSLPEARFKRQTQSYCPGNALSSLGLAIELKGQAPFSLGLELDSQITGQSPVTISIDNIASSAYKLESKLVLDAPKYIVQLRRVVDANGCEQAIGDDELGSTIIATAASQSAISIVPVETRMDYCVGESLDFIVDGGTSLLYSFTPTKSDILGDIEYHNVSITTSAFSRIATDAGIFAIESISRFGSALFCSKTRTDRIVKQVYAIPTVRMSTESEDDIELLREGETALLDIHLTGAPPFSFVLVREALRSGKKKGKVIDTYTVSDIQGYSHSLTVSEPGTYRFAFVQDAYCSYPAAKAVTVPSQKAIML